MIQKPLIFSSGTNSFFGVLQFLQDHQKLFIPSEP